VKVRAGSRILKYASAGHNPPLLIRKNGSCERLEDEGMMIGFSPGQTYRESRVSIRRGDVLVLYTDGITEAQAASGEMFGEERLVAAITSVRSEPAGKILEWIFTEVARFADGAGEGDDATAIVLKAVLEL
jgi:sigma-B regulation protein RsbU (phosphoserine phosphatase)